MKNKLKKIFAFVLILSWISVFAQADSVDFSDFVNDIVLVKESKKQISLMTFLKNFEQIKDNKCNISYQNSFVEVSPICLLNSEQNFNLSVSSFLEYFTDWLDSFSNYYYTGDSFIYKPAEANYHYSVFDKYRQYQSSFYEKIAITYLESKNQTIRIDKSIFSRFLVDRYSFYIVPTDLTNRSNCSLTNYKVAISMLDWFELKAWEQLDFNKIISYNPEACKWTKWNDFMFFAGSCGASTQLFRLSLIMPYLDVIERSPHSKWRALYYGSKLYWDDAAMYENSLKFIVQNNFDTSIYFKLFEKDNFVYLIWVLPYKEKSYSEVNKYSKWLSASVFKRVYDWFGQAQNVYQFNSRYQTLHWWKS